VISRREELKGTKENKKVAMSNAQQTLVSKYDPSTGKFDNSQIYTAEENKLKALVQEILAFGVRSTVNDIVMIELPKAEKPEKFLQDMKFDVRNKIQGNIITDEIKRLWVLVQNGRDYITSIEKKVIAESVLRMIKVQRYDDELHYAGGGMASTLMIMVYY
jgi:hypothetical protein